MNFKTEKDLESEGFKKANESLFYKKNIMGLDCYVKCGSCKRWIGVMRANKNQDKVRIRCDFCNDDDSYATTEAIMPGKKLVVVSKMGVSY